MRSSSCQVPHCFMCHKHCCLHKHNNIVIPCGHMVHFTQGPISTLQYIVGDLFFTVSLWLVLLLWLSVWTHDQSLFGWTDSWVSCPFFQRCHTHPIVPNRVEYIAQVLDGFYYFLHVSLFVSCNSHPINGHILTKEENAKNDVFEVKGLDLRRCSFNDSLRAEWTAFECCKTCEHI